jgi:hypothetical protein
MEQGGLAAAGGAHNGDEFPLLHREADPVQGSGQVRFGAVIFFQVDCLQDTHAKITPFQAGAPAVGIIIK